MRTYILSVLCASLASGVLCTLAPDKNSLSKYISFACALAVALTVLSPLVNGTLRLSPQELFSENGEEKASAEDMGEAKARYTVQSAAEVLCAVSGASKDEISAQADVDDGGNITEIRLYVNGTVVLQKDEISEKLSEIFGERITVFHKDGS